MRVTKKGKKSARTISLILYSSTLLFIGCLAERLIPAASTFSLLAYIGVFAVLAALTFGLACFTEEAEVE